MDKQLAVEFQIVNDCGEKIYQDLQDMIQILTDTKETLSEKEKEHIEVVLCYLMYAIGAVENAHFDLTNINFLMNGDRSYRWEPDEKR